MNLLKMRPLLGIALVLSACGNSEAQEEQAKQQVQQGMIVKDALKLAMIEHLMQGACIDAQAPDSNSAMSDYSQGVISGTPISGASANEKSGCLLTITFGAGKEKAEVAPEIKGKVLTLNFLKNGQFKVDTAARC